MGTHGVRKKEISIFEFDFKSKNVTPFECHSKQRHRNNENIFLKKRKQFFNWNAGWCRVVRRLRCFRHGFNWKCLTTRKCQRSFDLSTSFWAAWNRCTCNATHCAYFASCKSKPKSATMQFCQRKFTFLKNVRYCFRFSCETSWNAPKGVKMNLTVLVRIYACQSKWCNETLMKNERNDISRGSF